MFQEMKFTWQTGGGEQFRLEKMRMPTRKINEYYTNANSYYLLLT